MQVASTNSLITSKMVLLLVAPPHDIYYDEYAMREKKYEREMGA